MLFSFPPQFSFRPPTVLKCLALNLVVLAAVPGLPVQAQPITQTRPASTRIAASLERPQLLRTLTGHTSPVNSVAVGPKDVLVAGSSDRTISIWNYKTGVLERTLNNTYIPNALLLSNDGQTIFSTGGEKAVRMWQTGTGNLVRVIPGFKAVVRSMDVDPDGQTFATATVDRKVQVWDIKTATLLKTFLGHTDFATCVAFSRDRQSLVSASGGLDKSIRIWRLDRDEPPRILTGHLGWILSIALSSNGRYIASASNDQTVKLWDFKTGELIRTFTGHTKSVRSVLFTPDGRTVISGSEDGTVRLWSTDTGETIAILPGHTKKVMSISLSPNGRYLASASEDKTVQVWQLK